MHSKSEMPGVAVFSELQLESLRDGEGGKSEVWVEEEVLNVTTVLMEVTISWRDVYGKQTLRIALLIFCRISS
jgi:hypothetical protein